MLQLRPTQAATLDKVRAAWAAGATNVLVQAPCGFGKTELATAMLQATHENGKRGAFVCDRISLINQTSARFDKYGLPHGVIQSQHWRRRPYEQVQLCSIQTVQRRQWPKTDLLIVDEAHVLSRELRKKLEARDCRAIGLTATPFTNGLGQYFDALVNAATTNELIADGWLTPYRIFAPSQPDMDGVRVVKGEWDEKEAESRVLPIVGDCVAEYLRLGEDRKFIAFAVSVAHAEELQKQFMAAGVIAQLYTYKQNDSEREAAVEEFRKPDSYIRGLISIESLTRGFDVADVGVLILARPLRNSLAVHLQMIGRVLRTADGKNDALILDHAGNTVRFWDRQCEYMEHGATELDSGQKKEKKPKKKPEREPMTCPKCRHVHQPRPMCPACGYEYPRKSNVRHEVGDLAEVAGRESTPNERRDLYAQLLWIAKERGYATGWAAHKHHARTGQWPSRIQPEPIPPSPALLSWVRSQAIRYAKAKKAA